MVVVAACSSDGDSPVVSAPGADNAASPATALPELSGTAVPAGPQRGGVLRIAQATDPASCDLHMSRALSYQSVHPCNPMLSQIVRSAPGEHSVLEPDLALSWDVSDDGRTWTFRLRDGVVWHDGTPMTAQDLVFSLQRIIEPPGGLAAGRAGAIARYISDASQIRAVGGDTIEIQIDFPAASFLPNLASVYVSIFPQAATESLSPPSMVQFDSVVGSGPFRAGRVVRGSSYTLEANDRYYIPDLPYLDQVRFLVIPEPAVRLAALRAHEVDAIAIITAQEADALRGSHGGRITVFESPSAGGNTVQLNVNRPPFDDPRVRRAVNLAISRDDASLALGTGFRGAILAPGGPWGMAEAEVLKLPGYGDKEAERAEARLLLSDAGFPNGLDTTIHTRANPFFQTLSEFVAGQLATVGIRAKVEPVEPLAYQDLLANGEFEMIGHSHSFALDDPDAILPAHYSCGGAENFPGLCDRELDDLIQRQSRTLDPDERRKLLDEIERAVWDKDAKIWFQWSARRTPVWNNVPGMEPGGPSLYQGRRLEQVWVE